METLTDQSLLAKIAQEAGNVENQVVLMAVMRRLGELDGQAMLAKLAEDLFVRLAAVRNLTDQATLAKVALRVEEVVVSCTAAWMLTDEAL